MYAATSVFPSSDKQQIANQVAAVSSWIDAGFQVVSYNVREEVNCLAGQFPQVEFMEAARSGLTEFGRPYIYIADLLDAMDARGDGVYGIFNSDIQLRHVTRGMIRNIEREARGKLLHLHRYDIDREGGAEGEYYFSGMDAFFLDRRSSAYFRDDGFVMGRPEWDHWMVYQALKAGLPVLEIKDPIAYHVRHPQRWKAEQCVQLIKNDIEEYYSLVNGALSSIKGVVAEPPPTADLFVACIDKDVVIDDDAARQLVLHGLRNGYTAVKSAIGLGFKENGMFRRVCALHGSLKERYADAFVLKRLGGEPDDPVVSGIMAAYVDFEKTEMRTMLENKAFILYPAGKAARLMLECLAVSGLRPIGLADKNARLLNGECSGYTVFSTENLSTLRYDYVIVTSNIYTDEILLELVKNGIPREKILIV